MHLSTKKHVVRWFHCVVGVALFCVCQGPWGRAAEPAGWELGWHDRFDRKEIGEEWEVLEGSWKIADGKLQGSGVVISSESFPPRDPTGLIYTGGFALGYLRMEFGFTPAAATGAAALEQAKEWEAVGLGCFINALLEDAGKDKLEPGYTFQMSGRQDAVFKIIKRGGQVVASKDNAAVALTPGKRHQIVVENEEGNLRFFVDGQAVFDQKEMFSIMGSGYDKVGFCFRQPGAVDDVKVYFKRLPGGLDRDEML